VQVAAAERIRFEKLLKLFVQRQVWFLQY